MTAARFGLARSRAFKISSSDHERLTTWIHASLRFVGFGLARVRPIPARRAGGIWSSGPDLPTDLVRATGVYFPANGRFYAMGGRTSDTAGADMPTPYEFDPNTNTWAFKTAPFPDNQVNNMACGVLSVGQTPYIYCVGGSATGSTAATTRVFRYDPVSDKIETAGIQPWNESAPDTLPGGFTVFQNKLYILGGLTLGTSCDQSHLRVHSGQCRRFTVGAESRHASGGAEFRPGHDDREPHLHRGRIHLHALCVDRDKQLLRLRSRERLYFFSSRIFRGRRARLGRLRSPTRCGSWAAGELRRTRLLK